MKSKLFAEAALLTAICLLCGCAEKKSIIIFDSTEGSGSYSSSVIQSTSTSETPPVSEIPGSNELTEPIESSSSDLPPEPTDDSSVPDDSVSESFVSSSSTSDLPPFSDTVVTSSSSESSVSSTTSSSVSSSSSTSSSSTTSSSTAESSSSVSFDIPGDDDPPETELTPIMGRSVATVDQMTQFILKMNPDVAQSVIEMIPYYLSEGEMEGVRGDIAFAQSCVETGYFRFEKTNTGSAVTIDQNNFCGLGVIALGVKGESFETPQLGIRAQIQHLKAYGSTLPLNGVCVDPRFTYVTRGCAEYVEWLGIQENPYGKGWAGGANYGYTIMNIYMSILSY